jgi:hypothetical protein
MIMTNFQKTLIAAAVTMMSGAAYALPVFEAGINDWGFDVYDSQYRSDTACAASSPGTCLGAGTGPTGWQLVNNTIAGNIQVGDQFAGVLLFTRSYMKRTGLPGIKAPPTSSPATMRRQFQLSPQPAPQTLSS